MAACKKCGLDERYKDGKCAPCKRAAVKADYWKTLSFPGGRLRKARQEKKAYERAHYAKNKDKYAERHAKWEKDNPQSGRRRNLAYRTRKYEASGVASERQIADRVSFWGEKCYICSADYEAIDHVKPLSLGGSNWPSNLRPICRSCNSRKHARPLEEVVNGRL